MEPSHIRIRGARMHNLKNISVDLPRNRLIVFTGLSGSGKSTLAFDTLYAEGQRRYVESLSTYARQFLGQMDKPEVDLLEGLSPAVSIEQRTTSRNPRSTVGTVTEIYDYLRLLFARIGLPHCPQCGKPIQPQSIEEMIHTVLSLPEGTRVMLLAPLVDGQKGEHREMLRKLVRDGFVRARIDGTVMELAHLPELTKNRRHSIEVVVDRLVIKPLVRDRLADSIATSVTLSGGLLQVFLPDQEKDILVSQRAACAECGISMPELSPQLFSFNNPKGACPQCSGLGARHFFDPDLVVPDPSLSLNQGALAPWGRRSSDTYGGQLLAALARHYSFNADSPFHTLPDRCQKIILHGSGKEKIDFHYQRGSRRLTSRTPFEGVLPQLERRYRETQSAWIREELEAYMNEVPCSACHGARLRPEALAVFVGPFTIHDMTRLPIHRLHENLADLTLSQRQQIIATPILKEINERLGFLANVGLGYLSLERRSSTLSGGEAQRIRLASQIGSGLAGVLYILDEPSIGLHQRDNMRLISTLIRLRDLGNTVIVVEHDTDTILTADHVLDMGPAAGVHGGSIVYSGSVAGLQLEQKSLTGGYLTGRLAIPVPTKRRRPARGRWLSIKGAHANNLKNISVSIPVGLFTCVTGVSGSGKSSLVLEALFHDMTAAMQHGPNYRPLHCVSLENHALFDKIINIDQAPIGRTPRSNPATYTGVFGPVRELFARLPEARARGYQPGRFSFNVKGGRCETCEGDGVIKIAMHFLPDLYVTCEACRGKRYNSETLAVSYRGKTIADILAMTIEEAVSFFNAVPVLHRRLTTLVDVGLGYLTLGQSSITLSGGEAQRIKLARELNRRSTGATLYILDEPTTGLHPHDIRQLLTVLERLVAQGNTVVVIEHNLDVIKTADYLIDLGPEGGDGGGEVVAKGTPETICRVAASHTGRYLKKMLATKL